MYCNKKQEYGFVIRKALFQDKGRCSQEEWIWHWSS